MSKTVLLVIAKKIFRDEEYLEPKQIFEDAGFEVTTASSEPGPCEGKLGAQATAEISVADAAKNKYDTVVFCGGGGAEQYIDDPDANALIEQALKESDILAAICLAPSILAHAGVLKGIEATAWEGQKQDLLRHGAIWNHVPTVTSTHSSGTTIITGNGPSAATEFGQVIRDCMLK